MATREDRYYSSTRARTPGAEQGGAFFQTGQGGRTLLPPIDSAFPISHFPVPPQSQYSQQRRYDYNQPYNNQWGNQAAMSSTPQPTFPYYDDGRYSNQQAYSGMYIPRPATTAPHHHDTRKLPPLSTHSSSPPRDERWAPSSYGTTGSHGPPPPYTGHIRSPTASYPASYNPPSYPAASSYPYQVGVTPPSRPTQYLALWSPPPGSSNSATRFTILNETYARTAFPSTEERQRLAKQLDMSPRSVQIWFQNKRQSTRQTNRQSSTPHQSFSMASDEQLLDEMESPTSQLPSSSHRRMRSQEDALDLRPWPSRGY
ncbi:Homeobox domain-containing protein [Mycena indigotica]|uniref:Homeobox domain-containing protein n=1 Tax=Mycena indigotica TaxID=2126181 RepID=A0A8H6WG47_9AGAR|nr:Homeobox domain-containing protein [Mycena indigotica]KAF7315451.1 Homeobox domain-containing protein [Mycena indigotica]